MIKSTELRKGNKFIGIAGIQTVLSICDNTRRGTLEYQDDKHREMYSDLIECWENRNQYKPCEIEGVLLTPDVLENIYFTHQYPERPESFHSLDIGGSGLYINYRKGRMSLHQTGVGCVLSLEMPYLHQLQNFYFSIFQVELDVSKVKNKQVNSDVNP